MTESEFMRTLLSAIAVGSGLFLFGCAFLFMFWRALDKESQERRASYATIAKLVALIAAVLIVSGVLVKLTL